jgi:hypothetical protein
MVWYQVVRYDIWCSMIWYLLYDMVGYLDGMAGSGVLWCGICDMVWYGMVWYGMVWYGMIWYGMVGSGFELFYLLITKISMATFTTAFQCSKCHSISTFI